MLEDFERRKKLFTEKILPPAHTGKCGSGTNHRTFADKRAALTAAFLNRFAIGFAIGAAQLPWPGWLVGLTFGLLLSVPEAIITKAWAPIIGMGGVGGLVIGVAVAHWGTARAAA